MNTLKMDTFKEDKGYYASPRHREALRGLLDHPAIERSFFLTGGTALSVFYLHHRISDDLDLFTLETVRTPDGKTPSSTIRRPPPFRWRRDWLLSKKSRICCLRSERVTTAISLASPGGFTASISRKPTELSPSI
jgi:hypothetical protein